MTEEHIFTYIADRCHGVTTDGGRCRFKPVFGDYCTRHYPSLAKTYDYYMVHCYSCHVWGLGVVTNKKTERSYKCNICRRTSSYNMLLDDPRSYRVMDATTHKEAWIEFSQRYGELQRATPRKKV